MPTKIKTYKFKVTDKELDEVTKFHFTKEIEETHGIKHTSVYNIINKNFNKNRTKYAKYDIEHIKEHYVKEY